MAHPIHSMVTAYWRGLGDIAQSQASLMEETERSWQDWAEAQRESFINFSQQMADAALKIAQQNKQHVDQRSHEFNQQRQQHRAAAQ